jgi:FMN phosphatase YigB (HAD superfamily)
MLNVFFPEVPWEQIKCVGFDLDGTLYDEFAFIHQVYQAILEENAACFEHLDPPLQYMLDRWLEKGSSYNRIFDETFERFGGGRSDKIIFIEQALKIFRRFEPDLVLSPRNRHLLDFLRSRFDIFLISDGSSPLQRRKFQALRLDAFFPEGQVVFTGELGPEYCKPETGAFEKLQITHSPSEILYFGDRNIDREFARRLGIHFQKVYNMVPQ